jgi:hypothetical protein
MAQDTDKTAFVQVGKHIINLNLVELVTRQDDEISIRFADSSTVLILKGEDATVFENHVGGRATKLPEKPPRIEGASAGGQRQTYTPR